MWILHHIDYISKSKRVSKDYISELKNLHKIIYEENSLDEFLFNLSFDEIIHISKNTILQFFLSKSNIEIVSNWCKLKNIKFKQNNRGNQYWYNGYFFKSNHEFSIGKYLIDSNVRFKANLRYPGLSYYYDFYLEDHDLYVEYMGMRDKDYTKKIKKLKSSLFNIAWIKTINELKLIINEKNYKQ